MDLYFKGEVEACGHSFVTDSKWTCTQSPPADNAWLTPDFDDAKWERATWVCRLGVDAFLRPPSPLTCCPERSSSAPSSPPHDMTRHDTNGDDDDRRRRT